MTIEEIKELIQVVNDTQIAELEVQRGDNRVRIKRSGPALASEIVLPTTIATPLNVPVGPTIGGAALSASPPAQISPPAAASESDRDILVKSPIVGTYYDAPAPGEPPFVKIGDAVEPRQVLCIIESMKLMNEIEAEVAGTVVATLVDNGRPVEYGESLFTIRPR